MARRVQPPDIQSKPVTSISTPQFWRLLEAVADVELTVRRHLRLVLYQIVGNCVVVVVVVGGKQVAEKTNSTKNRKARKTTHKKK